MFRRDLRSLAPRLQEIICLAEGDLINKAVEDEDWIITQLNRTSLHRMIDSLLKYDKTRFERNPNGIRIHKFLIFEF